MKYNLTRAKQEIYFEGKRYTKENFQNIQKDFPNREEIFPLIEFFKEWFHESPYLTVHTSGSTGKAKNIEIEKEAMMRSAEKTCSFLSLTQKESVLLCMPLNFIGAKMLIVRALIAGLNIYTTPPSTRPMKEIDFSPNFVAMTPQQASISLKNEEEKKRLQGIKHLLLGGMPINKELQEQLKTFPHSVWLGYGMTETLSHIALSKRNGLDASDYFTPLDGVKLSLSENETLNIEAPYLIKEVLKTNDRATFLPDGRFKILGRIDNVINTGGIKVQIEEIENTLSEYFSIPFQITALPDKDLGEMIVLLTEEICENWKEKCSTLSKYKRPKKHILVEKLPTTPNGKPNRIKARKLAELTHQY